MDVPQCQTDQGAKYTQTLCENWESERLVTIVGASYDSSCPRIVSAIAAVECAENFKTRD
jgi:flagellar biosynthesis/type III secretory pathway ATPase